MKTILRVGMMIGAAGALLAQTPQQIDVEKAKLLQTELHKMDDFIIQTKALRFEADKKAMAFVHDMSAGPVVKNAPYSAEAVTETIQQLSDGNRIVQRESSKLYRDSQGRERREQSTPMEMITISDPVAGESYTLRAEVKLAEKRPYAASHTESLNVIRIGSPEGTFTLSTGANVAGPKMFFAYAAEKVSEAKEESLGMRMIEGVQAEGFRSTTTIPAGAIGNDRAIEIVDERWFSPDLQMTVMTRHADPRSGETIYKLTNIQRVEQVKSLFEVPTSYAINEAMGFKGRVFINPDGHSVIEGGTTGGKAIRVK